MDPISISIAAIGLGMQAFGLFGQTTAQSDSAKASANIAGLEQKTNEQHQKQMELTARRQQMEVIRRTQQAQSLATNNATNQGAQFGSGLQGGLAQVSGEGSLNLTGINQNLQIGRNIFGIDANISSNRIAMAGYQSDASTSSGISAIGGTLAKSAIPLGNAANQAYTNFTKGIVPYGAG